MTPERLSRSARTAHDLVPCSLAPPARLSLFPKWVAYIIGTSAARREVNTHSAPNATNSFLLHRVIEWVDFSPIFGSPVAVVVIAVGMWATRLRCPSCPQRFPLVWT